MILLGNQFSPEQQLSRVIWDQDVRGTPTFRIYRSGRLLRGFSGLIDGELRAEIEKCLKFR